MRNTARISLYALLLLSLGILFWTAWQLAPRRVSTKPGPSISRLASNVAAYFPQSKESQFREGLRNLNHAPIDYYGIVVDQNGNPLPQTRVKWSVAYNDGAMSGHKNGEIATDPTGHFSITGENGKSLSVIPDRPGYKFIATNGGGIYSQMWPAAQRYAPDPSKPEILTLWKLQGAESLIKLDKLFSFPSGADSVRIDLTTGQEVAEGGDLKITIQKDPGEAKKSNPQDWSLVIEPLSGGIREVSLAEFRSTFQAPAQGYLPRYESKMEALNPAWTDSASVFAFVQARGGLVYSKLQLNGYLHAGSRGFGVQINALTNPNSSGNWEEDLNKIRVVR